MIVGIYKLANEEKVTRALEGLVVNGRLIGGLQQRPDWATLSQEEKDKLLLAEYDKMGGLIVKNGLKVKTGSFYDLKLKKVKEEPQESFVINIDEDIVEVNEAQAQALASAKEQVAKLKGKSKEKRKRKIKVEEIEDKE